MAGLSSGLSLLTAPHGCGCLLPWHSLAQHGAAWHGTAGLPSSLRWLGSLHLAVSEGKLQGTPRFSSWFRSFWPREQLPSGVRHAQLGPGWWRSPQKLPPGPTKHGRAHTPQSQLHRCYEPLFPWVFAVVFLSPPSANTPGAGVSPFQLCRAPRNPFTRGCGSTPVPGDLLAVLTSELRPLHPLHVWLGVLTATGAAAPSPPPRAAPAPGCIPPESPESLFSSPKAAASAEQAGKKRVLASLRYQPSR